MNGRAFALVALALGAFCATAAGADRVRVEVALDWTPNTNHTGLYVASERGYFAEEGLEVEIVQPGPTTSIQLTATGKTAFGISMQEYVTMARAQGIPVVSVAAVIQHNTSGFAALADTGIRTVKDFEGRRYGGWGQDLERVMVRTVMEGEGANFATVSFVNVGTIEAFTAARRNLADFFWIFYGWSGIAATLEGIDFNYLPLPDLADVLDYYTPVVITSEQVIAERPELVRSFLRALARGYRSAIEEPEAAAAILLARVPELDPALVSASQAWLSPRYTDPGVAWGVQKREVWARFADWALENGLIDRPIDVDRAFTNAFLPAGVPSD
jgi:ABC-type nitrate/sulfonate/bicarbonate transport system substrate-binding protein